MDTSRILLSGFSGGARFSTDFAIEDPWISGVLACGAGWYHNRRKHEEFRTDFLYYGIIGRRDMNLPDMEETEDRISAVLDGVWIQYTGIGHVWPSPGEIEAGLAWLLFHLDETADEMRQRFMAFQESEILAMEDRKEMVDAVDRLESLQVAFPGEDLKEWISRLKLEKDYRKQLRRRERTTELAITLQNSFLDALTAYVYVTPMTPDSIHDSRWWYGEIRKLRRWEASGNLETSRMASRLLYLLEVHFDEDIENYLESMQYDKVLFLSELWLLVAPDKLWSHWNVASAYSRAGKTRKAVRLVQEMVARDMVQLEWIMGSPDFKAIHDDPVLLELMD
jgi:pentatricopeptide repeat protein